MTVVAAFVQRLAKGKPDVGYTIGVRFTGKREWSWDSRTGSYSESLPLLGHDEILLQAVLVGPLLLQRRHKNDVRQK